ncbi:MAG: hypothetical protein ACTSUT_09545 [Promethearchaeota archaeon]
MFNKPIIYVQGTCPFCNSRDVVYKKEIHDGNYMKIHLICKECRKESREIYYIEYLETEGCY